MASEPVDPDTEQMKDEANVSWVKRWVFSLGESDRDRAERIIELMGKDWISLSDLADAANVDNYQMARFLREHVPHDNCVVQEPVLERRIRAYRNIRRVQLSEYRRKVEVQVAEPV